MHFDILRESGCRPSSLTSLYSGLRNPATNFGSWKLFPTRIRQTLPRLISVLLFLPALLTLLDLDEILEIKISQNKPNESDTRLYSFYSVPPSSLPSRLCFQIFRHLCCYCPFSVLPTRLCVLRETVSTISVP